MRSWAGHPGRVWFRLVWLAGELSLSALRYFFHCAFCSAASLPAARAQWLQNSARRLLRVLNARTTVQGGVPVTGLLVSNHLGYLDILVFASLVPCAFVAKSELRRWPVFGWFARLAGTIFVQRERRTQVGRTAAEIKAALETGLLLVLFPEGTSSGGETVLPFKSALLEPASDRSHPVSVALLRYELDDGDVSEEVCYWKDMKLIPHLLNLLGKQQIRPVVLFSPVVDRSPDRKELARQLHAQVMQLRDQP